jgi:DNA-binding MarR family transcriptional regulator
MNARRLAELSHLSPTAVTKVLDRLDAGDYVIRRPSAEDRRAQVIGTSTGHSTLRADLWRPVVDEATAVLASLSSRDVHLLTTVLRRLAEVNRDQALRLSSPEAGGRTFPGK